MQVQKLSLADAAFEPASGGGGDVFVAKLIDARHGGPITVAYGLYRANQRLAQTVVVHDVMIILEGRLTITSEAGVATAGPGEIVYLPRGEAAEIRAHELGALTAAVTYPHWNAA